jgi:hypothetical protein
MSNDCSIKANLKIAPAHEEAAMSAVQSFIDKKGRNMQELEFDGEFLYFYIDLPGLGGMNDDDVQVLANQLGALVTEPGVIEFIDQDVPPDSEAAITCYWVAANEVGARQASVQYGLSKMKEWISASDFDEGFLENCIQVLKANVKGAKPAEPEFNFMRQEASEVSDLLAAAKDALPLLSGPIREKLEAALRAFENTTVVSAWSLADIGECDESPSQTMSEVERRAALFTFAKHYTIPDSDFTALDNAAHHVCKERIPGVRHLKVTLPDQTVRYLPVEKVVSLIEETNAHDVCEAADIALGLGLGDDANHLEVDCKHHCDAEGKLID